MRSLLFTSSVVNIGLILSCQAQIESTYQSTAPHDGVESQIICSGPVSLLSQTLSPAGTSQRIKRVIEMDMSLANACGMLSGAKCGFRYNQPVTQHFGWNLAIGKVIFDHIHSPSFRSGAVSRQAWHSTLLVAQICDIKCRCLRPYYNLIRPTFSRDLEELRRTPVLEWDFDHSIPQTSELFFGIRKLTLTGSNAPHVGDLGIYQNNLGTRERSALDVSSVFVYGAADNKPICDKTLTLGVGKEMSIALYAFLNHGIQLAIERFVKPAQFCLHFFYGGRLHYNLGGICLHEQPGDHPPTLRFPRAFQSPRYTSDYYAEPLSPEIKALLEELHDFCTARCRCRPFDGEDEEDEEDKMEIDNDSMRVGLSRYTLGFGGKRSRDGPEEGEVTSSFSQMRPYKRACPTTQGCSGPQECGSECECRVNLQTVDPADFHPGKFIANCAAALVLSSFTGAMGDSGQGLGGRSTDNQNLCACNTTYVSGGCCGSQDGLIWEPPEMKVGELKKRRGDNNGNDNGTGDIEDDNPMH